MRGEHTAVFVGPSITREEVLVRLPLATVFPPAQCGDVIRAARQGFTRLIMIDGFFGFVPAPWHKEILVALEEGIEVWGASSMGALRAAETYEWGMRGIGRVFEMYRDGVIDGDDEVAIAHEDASVGYTQRSHAMCDIRVTLAAAVEQGVLQDASADRLIESLRAEFYPLRNLDVAVLGASWMEAEERSAVQAFLSGGGFVRQKHLDALEAIDRATRTPHAPPTCAEPVFVTNFLRVLSQEIQTKPLPASMPAVNAVERGMQHLSAMAPRLAALATGLARDLHAALQVVPLETRLETHEDFATHMEQSLQGFREAVASPPWLCRSLMAMLDPTKSIPEGPDDPAADDAVYSVGLECRADLTFLCGMACAAAGLIAASKSFAITSHAVGVRCGCSDESSRAELCERLGVDVDQFQFAIMQCSLKSEIAGKRPFDTKIAPVRSVPLLAAYRMMGIDPATFDPYPCAGGVETKVPAASRP